MLTYPLSSGVPVGYDYANKPENYGLWFDGSNMNVRQYADLFGSSNLTQAPAITTLYSGAGLAVGANFWGGTWHRWPKNTETSVGGAAMDDMGFATKTVRSLTYVPFGYPSMRWYDMETAQDTMSWAVSDDFVNYHFARGTTIIYNLGFTPAWATGAGSGNSAFDNGAVPSSANNPPTSTADWVDFVSRVATRYLGKVTYYEFWNESESTPFWNGTLAQWATMLRLTSQTIKAIDPTAKIIAPASSGVIASNRTWLSGALTASDGAGGTGAGNAGLTALWADVVSFHYYYTGYTNFNAFASDLTAYKAILTANGWGSLELWCDELGIQNLNSAYFLANPTTGRPNGQDESRMRYVLRLLYLMAINGVTRSVWYDMDGTSFSPFYFSGNIPNFRAQIDLHLGHLIGGKVTRVNMLSDGRLAITANAINYLI